MQLGFSRSLIPSLKLLFCLIKEPFLERRRLTRQLQEDVQRDIFEFRSKFIQYSFDTFDIAVFSDVNQQKVWTLAVDFCELFKVSENRTGYSFPNSTADIRLPTRPVNWGKSLSRILGGSKGSRRPGSHIRSIGLLFFKASWSVFSLGQTDPAEQIGEP